MRSVYSMDNEQMPEWEKICKAYAKKIGAKLLFVNHESMGVELSNGALKHIYIEDLIELLK